MSVFQSISAYDLRPCSSVLVHVNCVHNAENYCMRVVSVFQSIAACELCPCSRVLLHMNCVRVPEY